MKAKFKLRFKTIDELEYQFGNEWRFKRELCWCSSMDYLLGQEIELKNYIKFIDENGNFNMGDYQIMSIPKQYTINGTWKVYKYQIKEIKLVTYNEKRILVYD